MARECYYVSLKYLRKEGRTLQRETSRKNKVGKKEVTKSVIVLSALAEKHERTYPEPTS